MKVSQINNNYPSFGMKFSLVQQKGNLQKAEKCFFDEVQLSILRRKVEGLNPKTDEFIVNLDSPSFKVEKDLQNKYFMNHSYDMNVVLKNSNNESKNFDLSEKNLKIGLFEPKDSLINHPQSPFAKLYNFVETLAQKG